MSARKGVLKRVVVNKHVVKANALHGKHDPPLSVQSSKGVLRGHELDVIDREGRVVGTFHYRPDKPLGCGASVWFETRADLEVRQRGACERPGKNPRKSRQERGACPF